MSDSLPIPKTLVEFGELVRERANEALSGNGVFRPGEKQCRWCKARTDCEARRNMVMNTVFDDFSDVEDNMLGQMPSEPKETPGEMEPEMHAALLANLGMIRSWCDDIENSAQIRALKGVMYPGYKLVNGRKPAAKWKDDEKARKWLTGRVVDGKRIGIDEAAPRKTITVAQAEKLLGTSKRNKSVDEALYERADPKIVLVPESDKRQEVPAPMAPENDFVGLEDAEVKKVDMAEAEAIDVSALLS